MKLPKLYIQKFIDRLSKYWIELFILSFSILLHSTRLDNSIFESHSFRQTQTAFGIRSLLQNNFDLINVELPIFGPPWKAPLEFPVYQFFAAAIENFFHFGIEYSGRLTSFLLFLSSGIILYFIARQNLNVSVARISLGLFYFTSYALQWGTSLLIEWTPVTFSLLATLVVSNQLLNNFSRLIFSSIFIFATMSIAGLSKITSIIPYLFFQTFLALAFLLKQKKLSFKPFLLILSSGLGVLPAIIWTNYADFIKEQNVFTMGLTSKSLQSWNFAYPGQRLDFPNYVTIFSRIDQAIFGLTIIFILGFVASFKFDLKYRLHLFFAFVAVVISPLIFLNLYYRHDYYLAALYPLLIFMISIACWALGASLSGRTSGKVSVIVVLGIIFYTWTSSLGAQYLLNFKTNGGYPSSKETIQKYTSEKDKLLVVNCDWDSTTLYFAERKGLMLLPGWYSVDSNVDQLAQEQYLDSNLPIDYWDQFTYLYVCGFDTAQAGDLPNQVDQINLISNKYSKIYLENGLYKLYRR